MTDYSCNICMDDEAMWDSGTIFVPIPEMISTEFFFLITNSTSESSMGISTCQGKLTFLIS